MNARLLKNSLIGAASGIAASFIISLILGFALLSLPDPTGLVDIAGHLCRFAGAAFCGIVTSKMNKEQGLASGALSGALYSSVLLFVSAFTGGFRLLYSLLMALICTVVSAVMGLISLPKEKSGAARRKALMKRSGM